MDPMNQTPFAGVNDDDLRDAMPSSSRSNTAPTGVNRAPAVPNATIKDESPAEWARQVEANKKRRGDDCAETTKLEEALVVLLLL